MSYLNQIFQFVEKRKRIIYNVPKKDVRNVFIININQYIRNVKEIFFARTVYFTKKIDCNESVIVRHISYAVQMT